jgi:hypothetical protein
MRYRLIGGLTIRFAASGHHADHALLLTRREGKGQAEGFFWP